MSAYAPYYPNGWQNDESGNTPINAAALNNMETGIGNAQTTADGAASTASTANTRANTAIDNAATAQTTANTANTTANEAKTIAQGAASSVGAFDTRITALENAVGDYLEGAS